jgi:hypothetical protein
MSCEQPLAQVNGRCSRVICVTPFGVLEDLQTGAFISDKRKRSNPGNRHGKAQAHRRAQGDATLSIVPAAFS